MSFISDILSRFAKKDMVLTPELQRLKEFEVMVQSLLDALKKDTFYNYYC